MYIHIYCIYIYKYILHIVLRGPLGAAPKPSPAQDLLWGGKAAWPGPGQHALVEDGQGMHGLGKRDSNRFALAWAGLFGFDI